MKLPPESDEKTDFNDRLEQIRGYFMKQISFSKIHKIYLIKKLHLSSIVFFMASLLLAGLGPVQFQTVFARTFSPKAIQPSSLYKDKKPLSFSNLQITGQAQSNFVTIENGHFSLAGKQVTLKGLNFYPHLAAWASMWQHWNGPQVAADLDKASQLDVNTLRILVPYGQGYGWTSANGTPDSEMLNELDQLIGMASQRNLRILLTLFDFYGDFPQAGTTEEAANWQYLDTIVNRYQADPRIIGWDIHNEPDNYSLWQEGQQSQVLDWLARTVKRVKSEDANHFVTIGFGNWKNLLLSGSGTTNITALSLVDAVALHVYDPGNLAEQVAETKQAGSGNRPIFLEEFGWPSAPTELASGYNETVQASHYQQILAKVRELGLDGAMAWTFNDITFESIIHTTPQMVQNFGLVRLDGTLKPAGEIFKDALAASPLNISIAETSLVVPPALTIRTVDPNQYALYFPQTGYGVPTPFKEYWNRMGGLTSFGYPISGVVVENGLLVQYFERARFEFHPEMQNAPDYAGLGRSEQLKRIVLLGLLGDEWLNRENRQFTPGSVASGQEFFNLTGHNLGGVFHKYWETNGGLARFGYPLSEEVQEISKTDGHLYMVQYFERARFEYHPEFQGTSYEVELGQLGRELLPPSNSR